MARRTQQPQSDRDVPPGELPDVTPSRSQPYTHDWNLQTLMELQKTVAVLAEKMDRVGESVQTLGKTLDTQGDKIDKLTHWQSRLLGGAAVLAAVVAMVWTLLNVVPWDRIKIEPKAETSAPKAPAQPN